jgi:hypothetical protein
LRSRNVLAAILKRRLPAATSNRTMQTPAHAQHAEAIGELIETPAQSVPKGNAAGAQPTVAPTAARARSSATTNQKGRTVGPPSCLWAQSVPVPGRFERSFDHSAIKRSCRHCRQIIAQPQPATTSFFSSGSRAAASPASLANLAIISSWVMAYSGGKLGRLPSTTNQTKEILKASKKSRRRAGMPACSSWRS